MLRGSWVGSWPASKQQGVRSDPRRTKPLSKLCSAFQTRGLDYHLKTPSGVRAVLTSPKNQSLQQTIAEHEDCPREPLGPRTSAGPGDQITAGRSDQAGLCASASRWPQVGWGLRAAPKGLGARDRPRKAEAWRSACRRPLLKGKLLLLVGKGRAGVARWAAGV